MKILFFYPENPLNKSQGNNSRALAFLEYLKDRNATVDFVSISSEKNKYKSLKELEEKKLFSKGYLIEEFDRRKNKLKYTFGISIPNKITRKIVAFDRAVAQIREDFNKILKSNQYDYIIISYAYWSSLIENNSNLGEAKLLVDTHDFLTSQFQNTKKFKLGKYFEEEIKSLNLFDEIFVISTEERYLFSQFINKPIHLVTHALPSQKTKEEKKYDIVYVASENEHNVKGAQWFMNKVYPLLSKSINILIIGKVTNHIENIENIEKIPYAEDLNDYYKQSKVVLCPMFSGTGLKIKVIEGLSFGLPIVCNDRGVDGLTNKSHNGCLVTNDEVEFAQNIEKLISDSNYYNKISEEARTYFNENHNQETVYKQLDKIFNL